MLGGAHSWLDRHPLAGDATPAALALTAALVAPVVLRRRAPVAVFAVVMLGCLAELALADQLLAATVSALVALYTLVACAPRRLAALGYAVTLATPACRSSTAWPQRRT